MRRVAAVGLLALATMWGGPSAMAGADTQPAPTAPPAGGQRATSGNCVLYMNSRSYGVDCVSGTGRVTVRDLLGDVTELCRQEEWPDNLEEPSGHEDDRGRWVLETCLKHLDPDKTFREQTEDPVTTPVWLPEGTPRKVLTVAQARAWQIAVGAYPLPMPQFGPAKAPRALVPTDVALTSESGTKPILTVSDDGTPVRMRAQVERLQVRPGVDDSTEARNPQTCEGPGVPWRDGMHVASLSGPDFCLVTYPRSSASKPGNQYRLTIVATWRVSYQRGDGPWVQFANTVDVQNVFMTQVQEIQSLNG